MTADVDSPDCPEKTYSILYMATSYVDRDRSKGREIMLKIA